MSYTFIKTKRYEKSLEQFLKYQQPRLVDLREEFKVIFTSNPFDTTLNTHDVYTKYDKVIFTSYIGYKVRLIWLMVKPHTIIPYSIIEDHDYHRLKKLYPAIIMLADLVK
jgi:mRNA-degrading endonuclease YafQ of YafQ-DinJ toxin-antitoxin module